MRQWVKAASYYKLKNSKEGFFFKFENKKLNILLLLVKVSALCLLLTALVHMSRLNPQANAASEYKNAKPAAKPAVVNTGSRKPADQDAVTAAMNLLKELTGMKPVSAVVATPVATNGVTPGTYKVASITVDSKGRVTASANPVATSKPAPTDNIASANISAVAGTCAQTSCSRNESAEAREIRLLKAKLAEVTKQHNELSGKYATVVAENEQLRSDLDRTTAQLLEAETESTNSQALQKQLDVEIEEVAAWKAKYEAAVTASRGRCQELQAANDQLTAQLSSCGEFDSILSQLINAQENIESLEEENRGLKDEVRSLKDLNTNQVGLIAKYKRGCESMQDDVDCLRKMHNNSRTEADELKRQLIAAQKVASGAVSAADHAALQARYEKLNAALKLFIMAHENAK
jgi:uncharacterized phage infection (PIP) family protein YhgE